MNIYRGVDDVNKLLFKLCLPPYQSGQNSEIPTLLAICERLYDKVEELEVKLGIEK